MRSPACSRPALLSGMVFFALVRSPDQTRVRRYAQALGGVFGLFSLVLTFVEARPTTQLGTLFTVFWVLGAFQVWAWALARLYLLAYPPAAVVSPAAPLEVVGAAAIDEARAAATAPAAQAASAAAGSTAEAATPGELKAADAARPSPASEAARTSPAAAVPPAVQAAAPPPAEVIRLSRRRFVIGMGGLVATFVVLGAELADVLSVAGGPAPTALVKAPIPFPNAGSAVKPVPGTRLEYTPVPDFYRVDIDLTPPAVDAATWRLHISGMVATPLSAHPGTAEVRLHGAPGVHHAGVHLQSGRRTAHRDHTLDRPVVPRRPRRRRAASPGHATRTCSRRTASTRRSSWRRSAAIRASSSPTTGTGSR